MNPCRRRAFLKTLGVAGGLAPFLPLMTTDAQDPVVPRRIVFFFTPHGTIYDQWRPRGGETDFELHGILEPLARHRSKVVVLGGMRINRPGIGAPHTAGSVHVWTAAPLLEESTFTRADGVGGATFGWNSAPSVDQVIASRVGGETRYASLELGVQAGSRFPGARVSYADARSPLEPENDPWAAFDRLFADLPSGDMGAAEANARAERRRRALDAVNGDLVRLSRRLSVRDRARVDAHAAAVSDVRRRLETAVVTSCAAPTVDGRLDPGDANNMPVVMDTMSRVLSASLTCGLTQVATIQVRRAENDSGPYPWLGIDSHHALSHETDPTSRARLATIYRWYAEQYAHLLDLLDSVIEADGSTLLDNTMVIWGSELGAGASHSGENAPFVVAGGTHGIRSGRFLDAGADHNRLLVSACHYMGLTDVDRFGHDRGSGPLPGLV